MSRASEYCQRRDRGILFLMKDSYRQSLPVKPFILPEGVSSLTEFMKITPSDNLDEDQKLKVWQEKYRFVNALQEPDTNLSAEDYLNSLSGKDYEQLYLKCKDLWQKAENEKKSEREEYYRMSDSSWHF